MAIDITAIVIEGVKAIPGAMAAAAVLLPIVYRQANKIRAENAKRAEEIKAEAHRLAAEQAAETQRLADEQAARGKVLLENQNRIEAKVNGNHKQAMKAIKAAGKYEGFVEGKREAHNDLDHAAQVQAKLTKRGARRRTDK